MDPVGCAAFTFADLPKEEGESWARKMPGHAMGSFAEKMTSTSHYDIPVTYVKCTEDKVIPPAHQQKMIDDFKAISRSSVDVVEMTSGHCPMVVHVDKTAEIIINAAKRE
jgi:predicted esterase